MIMGRVMHAKLKPDCGRGTHTHNSFFAWFCLVQAPPLFIVESMVLPSTIELSDINVIMSDINVITD